MSCKHCVFFSSQATFSAPCQSLGVDDDADPCPRFFPFLGKNREELAVVARALKLLGQTKNLSASLVLALLLGAGTKKGLPIGTSVTVKAGPARANGVVAGVQRGKVCILTEGGSLLMLSPKDVTVARHA